MVRDKAGNLYGTASDGGANGFGIVFKLDKTGKETPLYAFGTNNGDGVFPSAGLVQDTQGNLYGTTSVGGAHSAGVVFKLTP